MINKINFIKYQPSGTRNFCILIIFLLTFLLSCTQDKKQAEDHNHQEHTGTYTCPMHPQIIKNEPGICPICSMDLVPVSNNGAKEKTLMLSESQIKLANIKTIKITGGNFKTATVLSGRLVSSPLSSEVISSKFAGRIEQLFLKETGVQIKKGQPIYTVYSEDLLTLQKDYLLNLKQQETFPKETIYSQLTEAAKSKLLLYGYSTKQIKNLQINKSLNPRITVFAPTNGTIKSINISEGQYIGEGSPVFEIENLNRLWVEADIYPSEISGIQIGQALQISVSGYENLVAKSKVEFIAPQLNSNSQIVILRTSIANPSGNYQPGMFASVKLSSNIKQEIINVPVNAVLRDEEGAHIWVRKDKNTFEPRTVTLGEENEQYLTITNGLEAGEEIVSSGAYLLSSELKLKKGI